MVGLEFFRCWSCCLFPGGEWQWALELLSNLTDATLQANDVAYNAAISAWRLTDLEGRLLVDVAGVCQLQGLSFVRFCWISLRFDTGIEVADGAPQLRCKSVANGRWHWYCPYSWSHDNQHIHHVFVRLVGLLVIVLQSILVGIPPLDFKLVNFTGPVIASGVMDDVDQQNNSWCWAVFGPWVHSKEELNPALVKQLKTKWYEN